MKTQRWIPFASFLVLASLACNAFVSTAERLAQPAPAVTTEANGDVRVGGGPVITSVDNTRAAVQAQGSALQFLDAYAQEKYTPEELSQAGRTYAFTVTLDPGTTVLWGTNWCTTTPELLKSNWDHIQVAFSVNGATIPLEQFGVLEVQDGTMYCRHVLTTVKDWPPGATELETRVTFDAPLNDGLSDYPKGTHLYRYTVTVAGAGA
jgi:hypothetical protein